MSEPEQDPSTQSEQTAEPGVITSNKKSSDVDVNVVDVNITDSTEHPTSSVNNDTTATSNSGEQEEKAGNEKVNGAHEGNTRIEGHQVSSEEKTTGEKQQKKTDDDDNIGYPKIDANTTVPLVPAPKPPAEPDMNNLPKNPIPNHQKRHAVNTIKAIKRLKDASPFLHPVDIIKLNIPLYYNYIKRPMDLGTIERKLNVNAYADVSEILEDFNLMVDNCFKFNGEKASISQMARNIQASFEKHMLNMPAKDQPLQQLQQLQQQQQTQKQQPSSQSKKGNQTNGGSDYPKIRRDTFSDNGRPKREIHPPKPKDMPYDMRPRKKKFQPELRFCQQILKDLLSKKNENFTWPFLQPVDPVAMECPTYFDVVKNPMDLTTVQRNLAEGNYERATDFEKDIRLIITNCFLFNPEGTMVNMLGHKLEEVFNSKWADRPATPESGDEDYDYDYGADYYGGDDDEFKLDMNSITDPTIEFLLQNIERMTADLKRMREQKYQELKKEWMRKRKGKRTKRGKSTGSMNGGSSRKKPRYSSNGTGNGSDEFDDDGVPVKNGSFYPKHVTFEMKTEISNAMQNINEKMLAKVLAIIKEGMPDLKDDEEIELEMDALSEDTLAKLYVYLVGNKKQRQEKKDDEEEKRIESLKNKLKQFENDNNSTNGGGESSSEDEDEDSDISSEEE